MTRTEIEALDRVGSTPGPPARTASCDGDGITLGLLVVVALLLFGNVMALLQLQKRFPNAPGAQAPPGQAVPGPAVPQSTSTRVLYLQDLMVGVTVLQAQAPDAVRLTHEQAAALLTLLPQIRQGLLEHSSKPGTEAQAAIYALLTSQQKSFIDANTPQEAGRDLDTIYTKFDAEVRAAAR